MSSKYSSKKFRELYDTFIRMFNEEGDIYESTKKSVEEDYQHATIPSDLEKKVILTILKDAAIDFYKDEIEIIEENQYITECLKL